MSDPPAGVAPGRREELSLHWRNAFDVPDTQRCGQPYVAGGKVGLAGGKVGVAGGKALAVLEAMLWLVLCRRQCVGSARGHALAGASLLLCQRQDL